MQSILMIDGAFLRKKYKSFFKKHITKDDVNNFVLKLKAKVGLKSGDSCRIYFYDCEPCSKSDAKLPVSQATFDFSKQPIYSTMKTLLSEIKQLDYFAVRLGELSFCGWQLKKAKYSKTTAYTDADFSPDLKQKGVDMKIGLDIAWASYNKITEKIILVTADSDFVPAIKTARRNGIFVYLVSLHHGLKQELAENADVLFTEEISEILK